jgi:hypothetical protein
MLHVILLVLRNKSCIYTVPKIEKRIIMLVIYFLSFTLITRKKNIFATVFRQCSKLHFISSFVCNFGDIFLRSKHLFEPCYFLLFFYLYFGPSFNSIFSKVPMTDCGCLVQEVTCATSPTATTDTTATQDASR